MVQAGWDTIDTLCYTHDLTLEGMLYLTCAAMCNDDQNQTENQES